MNDRTAAIDGRRRLRDWAKGKPEHIRKLALMVRQQLCVLSRNPQSAALRAIIGESLQRLSEAR
jgi:predicted naringenin-chalcone synthase